MRGLVALASGLILAFAAPALAQPPVWVVRDDDSEMLLFGSVHLLPPGLDWRPRALDEAIVAADDIWFELDMGPDTERETARLAAQAGVLPPGSSLYAMLATSDQARLSAVAQSLGVSPANLDRLEPWLAEVALAAAAYARSGATNADGVEAQVTARLPAGLARRALETPAEQIAFFDDVALELQLASLVRTLEELENDPGGYLDLVQAWMSGDAAALDREALQPLRDAAPDAYRRLVVLRNERWTRELDLRLKGSGRTVVVVGVGHLVGEDGVPSRLRALGYSVTGP
jgi:uncharacterized protein YbaP (TraB family)